MLFKKSTFLSLALFATITQTHASNLSNYVKMLPYGATAAFLSEPVGNSNKIMPYNYRQMMIPASTQKIVTALAASLSLGNNFRFSTTLESTAPIKNGVINGDVVLRFSGDPTLTEKNLTAMFQQLSQAGLRSITGNLIIDSTYFSGHDKAAGWSWNNITSCYNAPPSAAIIDGNCFSVLLNPAAKVAGIASAKLVKSAPITVISEVVTIPIKSDSKYCELDVTAKDNNTYTLTGCLKQNQKNRRLTFAVQDGERYAKATIPRLLKANNIQFKGKVQNNVSIYKPLTVLTKHNSAPLKQLVNTMLKSSNNLIADTIFRAIGREQLGVGSWTASADAVKSILKNKAGIDLKNTIIKDGSGLSRQNLITAETMMQILQYIAKNDARLQIIEMLPVSGQDGTLAYRVSTKNKSLTGKIVAKTGYLDGCYNLAGFITTEKGNRLAFVQFINGYSFDNTTSQRKDAAMRFESAVYEELITK